MPATSHCLTTERSLEIVQEFVDSRGRNLRNDRTGGVLRGVKLLGLQSRNGRRYREEALRKAIGLYEGAKVNVNHPERNPLGPRDYRDRLGVIRNVKLEPGAGLFGDLHYNPKHALAEQLTWDAEHAPENVGLSHNVLARISPTGNELVVEEITRVQSVDLVADPATTTGLFEQVTVDESKTKDVVSNDTEHQALRSENESLKKLCEEKVHLLLVEQLLCEHGLVRKSEALSEAFLSELYQTQDKSRLARLIEDRATSMRLSAGAARLPLSREQALTSSEVSKEGSIDASAFAAAILRK